MCLKPDTSGLNALGGCDLGGEEVLVLDVLLSHLGTGFLTPFSAGVGFPGGTSGYEPTRQCGRPKTQGFCPWVGKTPWRRAWQPTPVFLPGESRDRGAWWATVHGVTESQTRLKWLSTHARKNHFEGDVAVSPCHLQGKKASAKKAFKERISKVLCSILLSSPPHGQNNTLY